MQINNLIDLIILILFLFALSLIGLPASIYLLKKGFEGILKYKLNKLPNNFLIAPGLGTYSIEVVLYGLILFISIIWILFFDKGGQLFNMIHEINEFI